MRSHSRSYVQLPEEPVWRDENTWLCRRHIPSARMPAKAERCLYGCPVDRPVRPKLPPVLKPLPTPDPVISWEGFDQLSDQSLGEQSIDSLRKYARHRWGIVGASKIRGGKEALLPLILAKRAAA